MQTSGRIVDLRRVLATRFPQLRLGVAPREPVQTLSTGVPVMDALLGGGLPRGEFTELVANGPGSGSVEVMHALLGTVGLNREFLALVDGLGSFDVAAVEPAALPRLLWVRCQKLADALHATDLLLRDRNIRILVLDLKLNPARELRRIVSSTWFRYARLLEQNQSTALVITPFPLVPVAGYRVAVESALGIEELTQSPVALLARLQFKLLRSLAEPKNDSRELCVQAG